MMDLGLGRKIVVLAGIWFETDAVGALAKISPKTDSKRVQYSQNCVYEELSIVGVVEKVNSLFSMETMLRN